MSRFSQRQKGWQVFVAQVINALSFVYWLQHLGFGEHNDPDMFQRLGSLMVASGVFFFALTGRNLDAWFHLERQYPEMVQEGEFNGLKAASMLNEFGLVVIGTIIWGYGDLFVCWVNNLECATC